MVAGLACCRYVVDCGDVGRWLLKTGSSPTNLLALLAPGLEPVLTHMRDAVDAGAIAAVLSGLGEGMSKNMEH
jgi:hypothetical protein